MTEPLTYGSDRLIEAWRNRFTSRRTIAHQMLEEAEILVRDAVALELEQHRRTEKTEKERELDLRERAVEREEIRQQYAVDRLQRRLAEAELKIAQLSPRHTLMREERETVVDGTIVRINAPKVPSYGDKNESRPWMLTELEEVSQRLRTAGGEDTTEVRFNRDYIEVCVPFPEFALPPVEKWKTPVVLNGPVPTKWWRRPRFFVPAALFSITFNVCVFLFT